MKELQEKQLKYINKADFIKDQLLLLFPLLFVWMGGLIWLLLNNRYRIIAYMYLSVIILLMMGSGKGYYSLGAYPMLLAAGGVWLEKISITRRWIRYASVSSILFLALPLIPLLLPIQPPKAMYASNKKYNLEKIGILKWEDQENHALQQDYSDMLGWKELAQKTETFFMALPDSLKQNTIIYCRNYGQAGSLHYYSKDKLLKQRIISFNGSFLLWMPEKPVFKNIILVSDRPLNNKDTLFTLFQSAQKIDSVQNVFSRQLGDDITFFQNAGDSAILFITKKIKLMESEFKR